MHLARVVREVEIDFEHVAADDAQDGPEDAATEVPGRGADNRRAGPIGLAERGNTAMTAAMAAGMAPYAQLGSGDQKVRRRNVS